MSREQRLGVSDWGQILILSKRCRKSRS